MSGSLRLQHDAERSCSCTIGDGIFALFPYTSASRGSRKGRPALGGGIYSNGVLGDRRSVPAARRRRGGTGLFACISRDALALDAADRICNIIGAFVFRLAEIQIRAGPDRPWGRLNRD